MPAMRPPAVRFRTTEVCPTPTRVPMPLMGVRMPNATAIRQPVMPPARHMGRDPFEYARSTL